MTDPLRSLKYLPWRSLIQVSALTMGIVAALEIILSLALTQYSPIGKIFNLLFTPPLGLLVTFFLAVGVGALAVYLLERFYPQTAITTNGLWVLVVCLILILWLKVILIEPLILDLNEIQAIAIIVGIFWKGKPYWRY